MIFHVTPQTTVIMLYAVYTELEDEIEESKGDESKSDKGDVDSEKVVAETIKKGRLVYFVSSILQNNDSE